MKASEKHYELLGKMSVADDLGVYQEALIHFGGLLFSPQSILVILFHKRKQPQIVFRWIPDQILQETFDNIYHRLGYMLDPFYQHAFDEKLQQCAYHLNEIAPDRFEQSDYFSTYFRATRMVDELGALFPLDGDRTVHLSMGRSAGNSRYRVSEVRAFKEVSLALMPKLVQLIDKNQTNFEAKVDHSELVEQFLFVSQDNDTKLSAREAQVAALIVQGHSSRAIGMKLEISRQTVKVHRRNLYSKLGISAQNELFAILMRQFP